MQHSVVSRHQRIRLTYDDLDRKSNDLARGLLQRGVRKGDRVAVSLGNNIEHAIVRSLNRQETTGLTKCKATYGLFKIGGILVSHLQGHSRTFLELPPAQDSLLLGATEPWLQ